MPNYGVHAKEVATSIATPVVAKAGLPYVVGAAPIQAATSPAKSGVPVLCTSWSEATDKLGYSDDWKNYPLCEFMYSHFQLFQSQPVIFCNVLDKSKAGDLTKKSYDTVKHAVVLPFESTDLTVTRPAEAYPDLCLIPDKDMANAVLKAKGNAKQDAGPFMFLKKFESEQSSVQYLFEVTVDGKTYGFKTHAAGKFSRIYFCISEASKQVDFVDGVKKAEYKDLSSYTGDVTVKLFKCSETITEAYPTPDKLTLIEEATFHLDNGHGPDYLTAGEDYIVDYSDGVCNVQLMDGSLAYDSKALEIEGKTVKPGEIEESDIISGINAIDLCLSAVGMVPDLIAAPGWSEKPAVAAVMAAKAENISGLFTGKAVIDLDLDAVETYDKAIEYKSSKNLIDMNEILCWPQVKLGDKTFHLSTQMCGLMAKTDTANSGVPFESPSNLALQMDSAVGKDGKEILLTLEQANILKDNAIVTALNFGSNGWVAWGNYTACYPGNTDIKDYFIPVSRTFDFIKTTLIQTYWSKVDRPMTRRMLDTIVDSTNIWLNGLVAAGALYGARVEVLSDENPLTDLMQGVIKIHVYIAPPVPMQECDFILEFDPAYIESALMG